MAEDRNDHILEGLYALVERAVEESTQADIPVPIRDLTPAAEMKPPPIPDKTEFPGRQTQSAPANGSASPGWHKIRRR